LVATYGFVLSETRTGWLALPIFLVIGFIMLPRYRGRWRVIALVVGALGAASVMLLSDKMSDRVELGVAELRECREKPLTDSSVCIRMQLAGTAWAMFREHPWTGSGDEFQDALREQMERGRVSEYVARDFGEPHNDFLFYLATYGLFGLLGAVIFVYLAPIW